jgi:hypothetical protein
VQANDPLGMATAVPITGPGGWENVFDPININNRIKIIFFILVVFFKSIEHFGYFGNLFF